MNAETPIALMSRSESAARKDFEARLERVRRELFRYLTESHEDPRFDVREVTREIIGMGVQERHDMFRHVMRNHDGAESLEGLEEIRSFIANALLDDSPCHIVMDPEPADLDEDVSFSTTLSFLRIDHPGKSEAELRGEALAIYREIERPLVLLYAGDHDKVVGPDDIVGAIAANRELERRRMAAHEDFDDEDFDDGDGPSSPSP